MAILDSDFLLVTETFNCADTGFTWGAFTTLLALAGCGFDPDFNAAFVAVGEDFWVGAVDRDVVAVLVAAGAFRAGAAAFAFAALSIFAGSFAGVAVFFIAFAIDQHKKITGCKQSTRSTASAYKAALLDLCPTAALYDTLAHNFVAV